MTDKASRDFVESAEDLSATLAFGEVLHIGRSETREPKCLYLPFQEVSSRHAEIYSREDGWTIVDLASKNGTWLNDSKLAPNKPYRLQRGDRVQIADRMFCVGPINEGLGANTTLPPKTFSYQGQAAKPGTINDDRLLPFSAKYCLVCQKNYPESQNVCPRDGTVLRGREQPGVKRHILDNRFEVGTFLGTGKSSHVYRGVDLTDDNAVVIKFPVLRVNNKTDAERFEQAAWEAVKNVIHPNIGQAIAHGKLPDGKQFLVSEFVDGQSLAVAVKRGRFGQDAAIEIFMRVCIALEYAHKQNAVHGNLKATNVFIVDMGEEHNMVKVIDFGLLPRVADSFEWINPDLPLAHFYGDPLSLSPEQCIGDKPTASSDIYSFGCLFYQALNGSAPFGSAHPSMIIDGHLNRDPEPFAKSLGVTPELSSVVFKCMAKEPQDRFSSAQDLKVALLRCLQG
jgi:hypothetical protein